MLEVVFHPPCAKAWRVGDSTRRLIYNLLRSPPGLWDALKECYNVSKPELAGPFGLNCHLFLSPFIAILFNVS